MIGDSNVARYLPLVKSVKDDPFVQDSTMSKAVNYVQLQDNLSAPQKVHPVIIVAALTNPLISHPFVEYTVMKQFCDTFFAQVKAWIAAGRSALPGTFAKVHILRENGSSNVRLITHSMVCNIVYNVLGIRHATDGP